MGTCEKCGNSYDKSFEVVMNGASHTFDSFECAISNLAPICHHCKVKVVGHGVEAKGQIYCCAHCSEAEGVRGLQDRI